MFSRFKIDVRELVPYIPDLGGEAVTDIYSEDEENVLRRAREIIVAASHDGVVEARDLQNGFFPTNFRDKYQVFISHSYKDIEIVKKLSNTLFLKFGVRCFVDSMVWGSMYHLLKEIDNKYCLMPSNLYDYEKRNSSTAHVHAMLSIALMEMIEQCECCIFIQSDNSTIPSLRLKSISDEDKTFSPWIYEEINYMNMLQPHKSQRLLRMFSLLNESVQREINSHTEHPVTIVHGLNLDNFEPVTRAELPYLVDGKDWLNILYKKTGFIKEDIKLL